MDTYESGEIRILKKGGFMPKPCWCEYDIDHRNNWDVSVIDRNGETSGVWAMIYCPVCGKKLRDIDQFSGEKG